jgi:hypothetical protein
VTTTGAQTYSGATTLNQDTVLTGSLVSLFGGDGVSAGGQSLTTMGNASLTGLFGTGEALKLVSVSGTTVFGGGAVDRPAPGGRCHPA